MYHRPYLHLTFLLNCSLGLVLGWAIIILNLIFCFVDWLFHVFNWIWYPPCFFLYLVTSSLGIDSVLISQRFKWIYNEANLGLLACVGRLGNSTSLLPCVNSRSRELWCFLQVQMNSQCQTFRNAWLCDVSNEVFVSVLLLLLSSQDIYLPFAHRPGTESWSITVPPVLFSIHKAVRICTVIFRGRKIPGNW